LFKKEQVSKKKSIQYVLAAVFPLSGKKNGTFGIFFGRQPTKILKIGTCIFGRNFLHWERFHKTQFKYFFKDVRDIFSRLKPFSGHSI